MDKPYKVIWKYKNDNRYVQYHMYIFVGNLRPELDPIYNKIEKLNLFDTWMQLSLSEIKKLEDAYGEDWYKYFFNMYHTAFMISQIDTNASMSQDLSKKFGAEWYDKHIKTHKWADRKLIYSYSSLIKDDITRKTVKKSRTVANIDDESNLDYKLKKKSDIKSILEVKLSRESLDESDGYQKGGSNTINTRVRIVEDSEFRKMLSMVDDLTENSDISENSENNTYSSEFISDGSPDTEYNMNITENESSNNSTGGAKTNLGFYNWKTKEHYALNNFTLYGYDKEDMLREINKGKNKSKEHQRGGKNKKEADNETDDYNEEDLISMYADTDADVDTDTDADVDSDTDADLDADDDTNNKTDTKKNLEIRDPEQDEFDLMKDEELDMEEIQMMYQHEDVEEDSNVTETSNLIKKALNDENLFKKNAKTMIEFDQDKDSSIYAEKIKDVYHKKFVKTQFLYGDDTIKTVKNKICCAMKNNKKFSNTRYLIPSRQYLWSEYIFNNKIEKVMIGQKWIRRNELLDIDIEPDSRLYMYEQLKDQLGMLRHNLRRYGNKIRKEDDENNILFDYEGYITDREVYMIDVYNELGKSYNPDPETLKSIQDVYLKIYFPLLRSEDIKSMISYLNGDTKTEDSKLAITYETINNDMLMENEITTIVENVKKNHNDNIGSIFIEKNYVTQSTLHVNLRFIGEKKRIDLYRIFNEFQTDSSYPYIQYQTVEKGAVYKYSEDEIQKYVKDDSNMDVLYKWFEISPYGINFKVKLDDEMAEKAAKNKFMSIGLTETGRIEYKTQWQETDNATIDDIKKTYKYVKDLIKKINKENPIAKIIVPEDEEFKYAFINTIQKYEIPDKFTVNHNDLSEFSRFFYPYVALVIEPRKRQSKAPKEDDKSKFGTYLRYKRVHKYDNQSRLEQRVIFFLRNYEFHDSKLALELAKQFNITEERSLEAIQKTRAKYPNLKKSRKILKKLENIPKYKSPGIGIDIQGKQRDRYKIRISGARTKEQLDRIIQFMNILIYLYIETYLYKKKEMQYLKEKLKKLTNIAKRRAKVDVTVAYERETKTVKQMAIVDKRRIGFKPEKGQSQWTRSCQNSGDDKKRRPQQYNSTTVNELIKKGFVYNEQQEIYEKKIIPKGSKGKNKPPIIIKTIKLPEIDDSGNNTGNYIHYSCDPEENGEHMYIGFLTRSSNPFGQCMPCCFKKDPATSDNKVKREFFNQCLGKSMISTGDKIEEDDEKGIKTVGDKLYILQDTNKIPEGRFGFLPKYLDRYFNTMLEKEKKIRHHYLESTKTGYFFKFGSVQSSYQFLNAVGATLNMNIDDIKTAIIKSLEADKSEQIFTSLNNGDIKTQFETRENFIEFIKKSPFLDYHVTKDIVCIPGVLTAHGLNLVIFRKKETKTKTALEKERVIENYYLDCRDPESFYTITDPMYKTIFLVRDNKNYYPILLVLKEDKNSKTVDTINVFTYKPSEKTKYGNIVEHISDYYIKNCSSFFTVKGESNSKNLKSSTIGQNANINAKTVTFLLRELGKQYSPRYQIIDIRNKCKYLITNEGCLIPVRPSGCPWDVQIIKSIDKYVKDLDETYKNLIDIYVKSNKSIPVKPIGVYYESLKGDELKVNSIMTKTKDLVPITPITVKKSDITKMKLIFEKKPLTDKIDKEILKGSQNYQLDDRIISVSQAKFENEAYNLFRLEFSNYINKNENDYQRKRLEKIMNSDKITKNEKIDKIRLLLYKIIDPKLHIKYIDLVKSRETDQAKADIEDRISRSRIEKIISRGNKDISDNDNNDNDNMLDNVDDRSGQNEDDEFKYLYETDEVDQKGGSHMNNNSSNNNSNNNSNRLSNMFNLQTVDSIATINGYPSLSSRGYDINRKNNVLDINDKEGLEQYGGKVNKFIHRISKLSENVNYYAKNDRSVCEIHENREECNSNPHCRWAHESCFFSLTTDMIVAFVNRISEELASNSMKAYEIMKIEGYFVSDIVDRNRFTKQPGQKIIRATSSNIKRILKDLFGSDNIPTIGKRKYIKASDVNYQDLNIKYSILDLKNLYLQKIINNNITIFRAYANGYYWLVNSFYDKTTRNLGYYNPLQSDLANRFKSAVIEWVADSNNIDKITPSMIDNMNVRADSIDPIMEFVNRLSNDVMTVTPCITELLVLSKINNSLPIIVRSDNFEVLHVFDNGKHIEKPDQNVLSKYDPVKSINIKFGFLGAGHIPDSIDVLYYK